MKPRGGRDAGSITLFALIFALALLLVVGLVVDGGGRLHALQRADSIAREAARVAGEELTVDADNGTMAVNQEPARAAGLAYLAAAGCAGGSVVIAGLVVTATCPYTYEAVFLPVSATVTGVGSAEPFRV
jgi:Flp pilus assembly protein TadG